MAGTIDGERQVTDIIISGDWTAFNQDGRTR
jgi:hypothetical protein